MHIIRVPRLRDTALQSNIEFDERTFTAVSYLWQIYRDAYTAIGSHPSKTIMKSEIISRLPRDNGQVMELMEAIYTAESSQLNSVFGFKLYGSFYTEQLKVKLMQQLSEAPSDPEAITDIAKQAINDAANAGTSEHRLIIENPFDDIEKYLECPPREPTGFSLWDKLAGGGHAAGEVIILLAPTGGGKTTLALQLAKSQAVRKNAVGVMLYEQTIKEDVSQRLVSLATDESRKVFEHKQKKDTWTAEIRKRYEAFYKEYKEYFHFVDCTKKKNNFITGTAAVRQFLKQLAEKDIHPKYILLDWFLPMLKRHLAAMNRSQENDAIRNEGMTMIDEMGLIAKEYETRIVLFHQLNADMSRANPKRKPTSTDAMEFRTIAYNADACFILSNRDQSNICWFLSDKLRRGGLSDMLVRLNGEKCKFESAENVVMVDQKGNWRKKDEPLVEDDPDERPSTKPALMNAYV